MYLPTQPFLSGHVAVMLDGMPGVFETLQRMRMLADEGSKNLLIRQAAANIVFLTPERDELSEVRALFEFVRGNIRYVKDVYGVETLATAEKTLQSRYGDCDDQSVLLAALFQSIGYKTRFVLAGYSDPETAEHVYLQVFVFGELISCDPTEQGRPLGWEPPDAVYLKYEVV